jgi:hypothetical protein
MGDIIMSDIQNITEYIQNKQKLQISIQNEVIIGGRKYTFSRREVHSASLSIYLPTETILMSDASTNLKYPMADRPKIILTTIDETTNFLFTPTNHQFSPTEAKDTTDGFRAVIKRMNPSLSISEPQLISTERGKEIYWFDYSSPVLDTELYNLMYFMEANSQEINNTLFIGGFNCPAEHSAVWKILFLQMMESITIIEEEDDPTC